MLRTRNGHEANARYDDDVPRVASNNYHRDGHTPDLIEMLVSRPWLTARSGSSGALQQLSWFTGALSNNSCHITPL